MSTQTSDSTPLTMRAGELAATVEGGRLLSVTSLRHRGDELLVRPEVLPRSYTVHGIRAGITLLHPWANRLGSERFVVAGGVVDAGTDPAVGRDPAGLPIHGRAPAGAWTPVPAADNAGCHAVARFAAVPAFPWAHDVEVEVALSPPACLVIATTVRCLARDAVPVAFGWHPYFRLPGAERPSWRLALPTRSHLQLDAHGIPTGASTDAPAEDEPLGRRTFDDGYEGLRPGACLAVADGERRVAVRLDAGFPCAQVFAPGDADVVSLEPMTAPADALRSGRGLCWATPETPYAARFTVEVGDAP